MAGTRACAAQRPHLHCACARFDTKKCGEETGHRSHGTCCGCRGPGRPGNTAPRNHSPGRAGASSLPPHSREEDGYGARAPERVKGPPASPSCLTYPHLDLEDSTGGVGQPGCQLSFLPSGAQYLAYNRHRVNTSPSAPGTHPPGLVGLPRGSSPAAWSGHPADTSKPLANSFFSFALVTLRPS